MHKNKRPFSSMVKSAEKISEVIGSMPNSFPEALVYLMEYNQLTIENLAEYSSLGTATIKRLRKNHPLVINMGTVVRLCVGMRLHPLISMEFIKLSPNRFCPIVKHILYQELLLHCCELTDEQCEKALQQIESI